MPDKKEAVVKNGKTRLRKKSDSPKLKDVFISEDMDNVKSYVLFDVLIPGIKKIFFDTIKNALEMALFGEKGTSGKSSTSASRINYRNYYPKDDATPYKPARTKSSLNYDEIVFETREDAEAVLNAMESSIQQYKVVSVGDLYDFADIPSPDFTALKYGWNDLREARVMQVRDGNSFGYILKLPTARPLN